MEIKNGSSGTASLFLDDSRIPSDVPPGLVRFALAPGNHNVVLTKPGGVENVATFAFSTLVSTPTNPSATDWVPIAETSTSFARMLFSPKGKPVATLGFYIDIRTQGGWNIDGGGAGPMDGSGTIDPKWQFGRIEFPDLEPGKHWVEVFIPASTQTVLGTVADLRVSIVFQAGPGAALVARDSFFLGLGECK